MSLSPLRHFRQRGNENSLWVASSQQTYVQLPAQLGSDQSLEQRRARVSLLRLRLLPQLGQHLLGFWALHQRPQRALALLGRPVRQQPPAAMRRSASESALQAALAPCAPPPLGIPWETSHALLLPAQLAPVAVPAAAPLQAHDLLLLCACSQHLVPFLFLRMRRRPPHPTQRFSRVPGHSFIADPALSLTSSGRPSSTSQPCRKILIVMLLCRPDMAAHILRSWSAQWSLDTHSEKRYDPPGRLWQEQHPHSLKQSWNRGNAKHPPASNSPSHATVVVHRAQCRRPLNLYLLNKGRALLPVMS